jgi:hypothetical protein
MVSRFIINALDGTELLVLYGCVREALEALDDPSQFSARIGGSQNEAKKLMAELATEIDRRRERGDPFFAV